MRLIFYTILEAMLHEVSVAMRTTNMIMEKYSFLELARKRRSIRKYQDRPVEREKLKLCLEAARLSPSACNSQPYKFIVVDDRAVRDNLAICGRLVPAVVSISNGVKPADDNTAFRSVIFGNVTRLPEYGIRLPARSFKHYVNVRKLWHCHSARRSICA